MKRSDGSPSLMDLDFDALKIVADCVHKNYRFHMRMACRALRDACPEANKTDVAAVGYKARKRNKFKKIHTITPMRSVCISESLFWWAMDPKLGGMPSDDKSELCYAIAAAGNVEVMRDLISKEWFHTNGVVAWNATTIQIAARYQKMEMIRYLRRPWTHEDPCFPGHNCPFDTRAGIEAALVGNLEILKWLHLEGYNLTHATVTAAAKGGNDRLLVWLLNQVPCTWILSEASWWAAYYGNLRCLEVLWLRGRTMYSNTCYAAAGGGHLKCLRFLHLVAKVPLDRRTCEHAARKGAIECLRFALEHGATCDHAVSRCAVLCGNVPCVKLLREYGVLRPSEWQCCDLALEFGHLELLKWLRDNGGKWHDTALYKLIMHCHPQTTGLRKCIEWARLNGLDTSVDGVTEEHLQLLEKWMTSPCEVLRRRFANLWQSYNERQE